MAQSLEDSISIAYTSTSLTRYSSVMEDINMGNVSFSIDLTADNVEVPMANIGDVFAYINNPIEERPDFINVMFPLNTTYYYVRFSYKSPNVLIKNLMLSARTELFKCKCDGRIYYGKRGLLLDTDMHPLFFMTLELIKGKNKWSLGSPKIYLDKRVYDEITPMNKFLKGKFLTDSMGMYRNNHFGNLYAECLKTGMQQIDYHFDVEITELSKILKAPKIPTVSDSNEVINQFLVDNVEEVIETL